HGAGRHRHLGAGPVRAPAAGRGLRATVRPPLLDPARLPRADAQRTPGAGRRTGAHRRAHGPRLRWRLIAAQPDSATLTPTSSRNSANTLRKAWPLIACASRVPSGAASTEAMATPRAAGR